MSEILEYYRFEVVIPDAKVVRMGRGAECKFYALIDGDTPDHLKGAIPLHGKLEEKSDA